MTQKDIDLLFEIKNFFLYFFFPSAVATVGMLTSLHFMGSSLAGTGQCVINCGCVYEACYHCIYVYACAMLTY